MRQRRLPLAGRATSFHRLARQVAARQQSAAPARLTATPRFAPAVAILPAAPVLVPNDGGFVPIVQAWEPSISQPMAEFPPQDDLPVSDVPAAVDSERDLGAVAALFVPQPMAPNADVPPRSIVAPTPPTVIPPVTTERTVPPAPPLAQVARPVPATQDVAAASPASVSPSVLASAPQANVDEPSVDLSATAPTLREEPAPIASPGAVDLPPLDVAVVPVRNEDEPSLDAVATARMPAAAAPIQAEAVATTPPAPVIERPIEPVGDAVEVVRPRRPRPSLPSSPRAPKLTPDAIAARLARGTEPVVGADRPVEPRAQNVEALADAPSGEGESQAIGATASPDAPAPTAPVMNVATPATGETVPPGTSTPEQHVASPASAPAALRGDDERQPAATAQARVSRTPDPPPVAPQPATAEIFAPRDIDRSPAAWLARLTGQARQVAATDERGVSSSADSPPAPASSASPAPEERRAVPPAARGESSPVAASAIPATVLPQPTRQFLRPIVGFDPVTVPVYSGPRAAELAAHLGADALATDEAVVLGAAHQPEATDPATLGVLAHELTHVARRREPRFIPPIARTPGPAAPTDEEGLARRVEARTVRAARDEPIRPVAPSPSGAPPVRVAASVPTPIAEVDSPAVAAFVPTTGLTPAPPSEALVAPTAVPNSFEESPAATAQNDWNGLPAPWEPLPAWLQAPTVSSEPTFDAAAPAFAADATGASSAADSPSVVSLAPTGRTLDADGDDAAGDAPKPAGAAPPAPDLDALARQVYSIVRRRLAADDRRAR